jgi:hypothetical protein
MLARSLFLATLAASSIASTGCATTSDDAGATQSDLATPTLAVDDVNAAIAKLDAQRNGAPIGRYYEDGNRVEGCWRNPAGSKLTDLKKAFYCSMPLEFRLCNTVVLLTVDESAVDDRYAGYLDCQKKVDAAFGGHGLFRYDDDVNAMYASLYLRGATLPDSDSAAVVAAHKPAFTSRSFPEILLLIGESLAKEAVDLSVAALVAMGDGFHAAGGEAR